MQAARPQKILSPLQISLAIQMHHHYRSRHVIDTLNRLGLLKFKRKACMNVEKSLAGQITKESTLYFVADNVDHNTSTLNGDNKMYDMGIIAAVTKGKFTQIDVQRELISNEDITKIMYFIITKKVMQKAFLNIKISKCLQ